jgi:hypothetical protein
MLQSILNSSQTNAGAGYVLAADSDSPSSRNAAARVFAGSGTALVYDTASTNGAFPAGVFKVLTNRIDATNATAASRSRLYINGALNSGVNALTGAASGGNSFTNMIIGASENGGYNFLGDIAEIIVYNSALSDADRSAVESYLMGKFGIT